MQTRDTLSLKDRELIALGASVAATCQPCTVYHVKAAREAGLAETEIREAVNTALLVREASTEAMAGLADQLIEKRCPSEAACSPQSTLTGGLVMLASAFAINCTSGLPGLMAAARELGASDPLLQETLLIARVVKKESGKKAAAATQAFFEGTDPDACDPEAESAACAALGTGCCSGQEGN